MIDEAGTPIVEKRRATLRLPPRHVRRTNVDAKGDVTTTTDEMIERRPGLGGTVTLRWPEYFPPSEQDKLAKITTIQAANGGRPVLSPIQAIKSAAPVFGVSTDADEELARILDGARLFADAAAGAIGAREPDADDASTPPQG